MSKFLFDPDENAMFLTLENLYKPDYLPTS